MKQVKNKNIKQHNCFQYDNNQNCFLKSKSENQYHVTLKTEVMMLKIQLCITGNNYI